MNIVLANKFFYLKGGAERVFFEEAGLLRDRGHQVHYFSTRNTRNLPSDDEPYFVETEDYNNDGLSLRQKIILAVRMLYYRRAGERFAALLRDHRPDVAHLHNIYHQISPAILYTLQQYRVPVVMTLHDYKLVCASCLLFADARICEACAGKRYFHCALRKCVKHSLLKSILSAAEMYLHHRLLRVYDLVDVYISPSKFLINKFREMGFTRPVVYVPNFVDPSAYRPVYSGSGKILLYVGRLSAEKGIGTLIEAMAAVPAVLRIVGDGPLREELVRDVLRRRLKNIEFAGHQTGTVLREEFSRATAVVAPSECYENNPRAVLEAFAAGKPVIGSRIGGIPELVRDEHTGWTFAPGDAADLREKIQTALDNPGAARRMGRNARAYVEDELNPDAHYTALMNVYRTAYMKTGKLFPKEPARV